MPVMQIVILEMVDDVPNSDNNLIDQEAILTIGANTYNCKIGSVTRQSKKSFPVKLTSNNVTIDNINYP